MTKWRECKLGDVVSSNNQSLSKDYPFREIKYLDTGSITCGNIESLQTISLSNAPSRAKRLVKPYNIVYSTVRPIQRHYGIIKDPDSNLVVSTGFSVIEANTELADPYFIYKLLTSDDIVELLDSIAEGSTSAYPSLRPEDIENLEIFLPPLPEQKAIAAVLSSLDDKIDLLQRQNKTLEAMAETLWRKMFVEDADPAWPRGKLGDVANINPLRSVGKGAPTSYLDMSNMPTSGSFPAAWVIREYTSGMKFQNGDTVMARITPCLENGKTAYINFLQDGEIGWGSTEYIVLAPKKGFGATWFYFLARCEDFRDFAIQNMTGSSGRQRVSGESVAQYEIAVPPSELSKMFEDFSSAVMERVKFNSGEIRSLEKMRDTLLPKLMSGEVRVRV